MLTVTDDADGLLRGSFRTALDDSSFAGSSFDIVGLHIGNCAHFAFSRSGDSGDTIASFTGLLCDGELKTVWHVVSDQAFKPPVRAPRPN